MPPADDSAEADLNDFAARLQALRPLPTEHRDRILFRAGQATAAAGRARRSRVAVWPAIAAGLALVVLGEGALLARRPPPEVVERIVYLPRPAPVGVAVVPSSLVAAPPPRVRDLTPRARWADQMARFGGDGVAVPVLTAPRPALPTLSGRDLLRQELRAALKGDDS